MKKLEFWLFVILVILAVLSVLILLVFAMEGNDESGYLIAFLFFGIPAIIGLNERSKKRLSK